DLADLAIGDQPRLFAALDQGRAALKREERIAWSGRAMRQHHPHPMRRGVARLRRCGADANQNRQRQRDADQLMHTIPPRPGPDCKNDTGSHSTLSFFKTELAQSLPASTGRPRPEWRELLGARRFE